MTVDGMFTGIIEEIGVVEAVDATVEGRRITIRCSSITNGCIPGDSVAVNGVCLTVTQCHPVDSGTHNGYISADILRRTWEVTNLHMLTPGARVNLESALRAGDRVGGHFVLGHVDGVGTVRSRGKKDGDIILSISTGEALERGIVMGGSIAVDGVSLTVARSESALFSVHLIPFTLRATTLGTLQIGRLVNLELDIMGKHLREKPFGGITEEFLKLHGFS
ncbi:MAG: riboflavin synthase [Candidatus Aureabacteria bacterium]|nr:riboflavin synthase [Candidatus Auribacterota bacterium]